LINAKDYGLVWLQPVGISDTIAQGGSKIRNELILHKPKKRKGSRKGSWS